MANMQMDLKVRLGFGGTNQIGADTSIHSVGSPIPLKTLSCPYTVNCWFLFVPLE